VTGYGFSANMGVNGIAICNLVVNAVVLAASIVIASLANEDEKILVFRRDCLSVQWMKEWMRRSAFSALESLVRNLAFSIMIIRMVNVVSEQGNYWVANNFIWNWLLLPSSALYEVIQKEIGANESNIKTKTFGYLLLTIIFTLFWFVTIPTWKPFVHMVMNVDGYQTVYDITLWQTLFYIIFIFNRICDGTFYGLGRTELMLIQSLTVNILYYGLMFVLYVSGVYEPTLTKISLMFGGGLALDFIPTIVLYWIELKRRNITIDWGCIVLTEDDLDESGPGPSNDALTPHPEQDE
jgi:Na+-driven multidrug efflux pump